MAAPTPLIIGTAGHVDHGKTQLIRALTGVETDRLREEKKRGISIELGFAPFRLPSGRLAGIVDVPGHERFIHNMLAGIGGIDLVLLVVDVGEGVMPQTREHLQILQLLQIPRGIVVLTKCDLAESDDWLDLVEEEVREELAGTFLETAPFCRVSAQTGDGLRELTTTIEAMARELPPRDTDGPLRLPIDRHFTVAGFGTVITGTLLSGRVSAGDSVELLPPGETYRVREVQVHGKPAEVALAGQRVALNLAGLERNRIPRGAIVATPGIFEVTNRMDARITLLPGAPRALKFRDPVHLHLGTARSVGLVALLDRDRLEPGESTLAQIHLDRPLAAQRQDRFIIRSYSPMTTIGGGVVIDPQPVRHKRFRDEVLQQLADLESGEKAFLLQRIARAGAIRFKELEQATGLGPERIGDHLDTLAGDGIVVNLADQWAETGTVRSWQKQLIERVNRFHDEAPLQPGMPLSQLRGELPKALSAKGFEALLEALLEDKSLLRNADTVALPHFSARPDPEQQQRIDAVEALWQQAGAEAKNNTEMLSRLDLGEAETAEALAYLFASGRLVRLNAECTLHREAYAAAVQLLADAFADKEFTLAQFRDALGSSRKQVQALLEHFDALKYTLRKGDGRTVWKLPAPPSP